MNFIKYFVIFALFAIQLSVQKSKPAKEISSNEMGTDLSQDSVEEPTENTKKSSKVKNVLKTAQNVLGDALKTGAAAAGHGLLGNILGGSSKSKKNKSENGIIGSLFGIKKDSSESDESSEEISRSKKKSKSRSRSKTKSSSDSDENETSSKKKSSDSFSKNLKYKLAGGVKDGIKKKLTKSLLGKLF
ncbi:Hypothetical protein SRAE_X000196000 [Strongyloides ratti]|uniref:Uncharacterized protein n=1 Tax=Strongyloides ratti TaxID=34506 RepID=A0A090KRW5_STRRB|nr:Hypothetical protein SRAE_X000196000 [Strongyloides ratti]CEF60220.1 Hypothetical protein SRAE_X000196000 [Strongyloides ratti]